jgi:hypothetical protein
VLERFISLFRADFGKGDRSQGPTIFRILSLGASSLLLMGWFLPWFVNDYSAGAGFSPQDAVISPPTGIGTFCVYIMAVTMLIVVLSPLAEAIGGKRSTLFGVRADRVRFIAALVGFALTVIIWFLVSIIQEEPLFGPFLPGTYTDSAVWLTMYGYALAAMIYGARPWILGRPSIAFTIAGAPFGIFLPLMFHQAPDFLLWAAGSLAIYMLLALGLNVVVGFAGLLDLGYAAFFAIGAYACASFASPIHNLHFPLWILIFLGAGIASLFGAILGPRNQQRLQPDCRRQRDLGNRSAEVRTD